MCRLCITAVLFVLGTGASYADETSAPAAEATASLESPSPAGIESPAFPVDSSSIADADSSAADTAAEALAPATVTAKRLAAPAPKTVDIKDFGQQTVCEQIKLPASRIVLEKRCYTRNANDRAAMKQAELRDEATQQQVRDLRRMQDDMERMQREREMARERAIAAMAIGMH